MISALFVVKIPFLTATALGVCLLLLNYIQLSDPHSSILSLLITLFYTDFFPFGRVFQVSSLSKGLCSTNIFLLLSLQVFQDFWSHKFFTLYQIQLCLYFVSHLATSWKYFQVQHVLLLKYSVFRLLLMLIMLYALPFPLFSPSCLFFPIGLFCFVLLLRCLLSLHLFRHVLLCSLPLFCCYVWDSYSWCLHFDL